MRPFDFYADTFSYPNELVWEYLFDNQTGRPTTQKRTPPPSYAHHCFVVARSARQFFFHAHFAKDNPPPPQDSVRHLVCAVVSRSDCAPSPSESKIIIPGFAALRQFSAAHPELLRESCGRSWQSYLQRGNWRMILPFTRFGQHAMCASLQQAVQGGNLPIIHVVTFPRLTINHTVLIFGVTASSSTIEFECYDPNICEKPLKLTFYCAQKTFIFPRTHYFPGGPVNVYEIYRGLLL